MNNYRRLATKLSPVKIMNIIQKRNICKCPPSNPTTPQNTASTVTAQNAHSKTVHVIFGPESQVKPDNTSKTLVDKLQTKMKNKPECVSKPPIEPEKPAICVETEKPPPVCEETKPPVVAPECKADHICGDQVRRDIFRQVVNESIFKQRKTKCIPTNKVIKPPPVRSSSYSTLSKIEHTLSKMLATAIVGFIAYWTWLYGNHFDDSGNSINTNKNDKALKSNTTDKVKDTNDDTVSVTNADNKEEEDGQ